MRAFMFIASFFVVASAGCLRKTEYKCTDSTQCGASGQCEDTGFCSFPDSACDSGRKYAEYSGSTFSNECVGGTNPIVDGSVDDGNTTDGMPNDGMTGNCSAAYSVTIGTHKYRVLTTTANWAAQETDCGNDTAGANTYLAIPDDQTELTALLTAANVARIWVGIEDPQSNEMFVTVNAGAFSSTSPLWDTTSSEPDDTGYPGSGGGAADCVAAETTTSRISDEKCNQLYPAVCECEP